MHAGPQGLLAAVRKEFWVLRGRDVARATVLNCLKCFRARPSSLQPAMGQLPSARVTSSRAFTQTGVDFARPLASRKSTTTKAYVAVFVCLSTKAIHLETVSALSTLAFMAALKRFMLQQGKPSHIWPGNGTNFVGARKELVLFQKADYRSYDTRGTSRRRGSMDIHTSLCDTFRWHLGSSSEVV